ncbi:hypothetical protein BB934_27410 [Microvirga ossetica]|uniref:Uncharacterized protein n=1 Tax=Microvirga ossetica TaxID=1882682 RepID=A0A1B2ENE0_9HYPH|nr:hypothetical protein BB934_27410 [Microvirga ossetica]
METVLFMSSLSEPVNQGSRPRSRVTVATAATRMAGKTATRLNNPTIRTWRPAAAAPALRSRTSFRVCQATIPRSRAISSPFIRNTHTTTLWVGSTGVAPARIRKVARADASADSTAPYPSQPRPLWDGSTVCRCPMVSWSIKTEAPRDRVPSDRHPVLG